MEGEPLRDLTWIRTIPAKVKEEDVLIFINTFLHRQLSL
jgi:hypothetical protein